MISPPPFIGFVMVNSGSADGMNDCAGQPMKRGSQAIQTPPAGLFCGTKAGKLIATIVDILHVII